MAAQCTVTVKLQPVLVPTELSDNIASQIRYRYRLVRSGSRHGFTDYRTVAGPFNRCKKEDKQPMGSERKKPVCPLLLTGRVIVRFDSRTCLMWRLRLDMANSFSQCGQGFFTCIKETVSQHVLNRVKGTMSYHVNIRFFSWGPL